MRCKVTVDTSHYPKEGPWVLPEGWCWSTIDAISESILYGVSESAKNEGAYKLLRITDIQDNRVDWESVPYTDYDDAKVEQYLLRNNDILFARTGATVGKSYLSEKTPDNAIYASYLIRVRVNHLLNPQYIKCYFESGYYWDQIGANSVGVGQPNVNGTVLGSLSIPIPPLTEQERIVEKASNITQFIELLDMASDDLSNSVLKTKEKILDLAIHGKLVPQDPSEEPAIELLRSINPSFKASDNLHYEGELPNGWGVTRLGEVIDVISGTSYQKTDIVPTDSGIRILRGGNIQNGRIVLCENDVFVSDHLTNKQLSLFRGDIALVASTGSSELIGKAAIADMDYQNMQIGAFLRIIRPKVIELSDYLGIIFQSDYYKNHIRKLAKGTNINNIKSSYLNDFIIPIPPYKEQQRIKDKVSELFAILNDTVNLVND